MLTLSRTVRFNIDDAGDASSPNTFAGTPGMRGLGRHYEVTVVCRGQADPLTGYLTDIKTIDKAVRSRIVPLVADQCRQNPAAHPADLLPAFVEALTAELPVRVERVKLRLSPYYSVEMTSRDTNTALLRQLFDFSAAHRLHVDSLSAQENLRIFGKCNNPAGHGHNYRIEPCVEVDAASSFSAGDLEQMTYDALISRYDHKHFNLDTEEFGPRGVLPSVENIARVFFSRLEPVVASGGPGVRLRSITVWETDRTSATYPAS